MMPRLEAEHAMATADQVAYGTGSLRKESARTLARRWQSAVRSPLAPPTPGAWVDRFVQIGIQVVKVPARHG